MIIIGRRYFGTTDRVPGFFEVRTLFFHVNFLPLFPIKSYLVLLDSPNRAKEIDISCKSIIVAWARVACVIASLLAFLVVCFAFINNSFPNNMQTLIPSVGALLISLASLYISWNHPVVCEASYERAKQLATTHLGPTGVQRVDDYFARAGGLIAVATTDMDVEVVETHAIATPVPSTKAQAVNLV